MAEVSYAAALVLAVVFAWAGVAKLRRRPATARAFAALGLASPQALSVGVPLAELALAVGLVIVPAVAGVAALAVLAGFTTFLALSVLRGDPVGCGCFGTASAARAGAAELVRNGFLAAAAVMAATAPGRVLPGPAALATVAAAAVVAAAVVRAVSRRSVIHPGRQGPAPGSLAPTLPGLCHDGATTTLVAFVAPTCAGCSALREALRHYAGAGLRQQVVELDDDSAGVFTAFGVRSAPFLVVLDGSGRVQAAGPARSRTDVERLVPHPGGA